MLLGVVSDVHCHDANLAAAIGAMDGMEVTRVLAAGDLVLGHRFSNEVMRLVCERGVVAIQGNHDMTLLGPNGARARTAPGHQRPRGCGGDERASAVRRAGRGDVIWAVSP
jgi:predicted phosphodiesterase